MLREPQKTCLKLCVTSVTQTHLLMNASFDYVVRDLSVPYDFLIVNGAGMLLTSEPCFIFGRVSVKIKNVDSLVNPMFTGLGLNLDGLTLFNVKFLNSSVSNIFSM